MTKQFYEYEAKWLRGGDMEKLRNGLNEMAKLGHQLKFMFKKPTELDVYECIFERGLED